MVYAERNVLHEEATTVEAETITVDHFRQRFCNNTAEKNKNFSEKANLEQQPKYKAPPPPPRQRRTSSSSTILKVCNTKWDMVVGHGTLQHIIKTKFFLVPRFTLYYSNTVKSQIIAALK